jgi:hypothetical protein
MFIGYSGEEKEGKMFAAGRWGKLIMIALVIGGFALPLSPGQLHQPR